jgi:hypothetical protein
MRSTSRSSSPNAESWKRKFEILEAQVASNRDFGPRVQGFDILYFILIHIV